VRLDGVGLDGMHRATAVPDASRASRRYGTGNPLEKIANTGHLGLEPAIIRWISDSIWRERENGQHSAEVGIVRQRGVAADGTESGVRVGEAGRKADARPASDA